MVRSMYSIAVGCWPHDAGRAEAASDVCFELQSKPHRFRLDRSKNCAKDAWTRPES